MHLGLTPWRSTSSRSASTLIEQAQFAEQLGYQSFWLPENHFNETAIPDPLLLLASVAGATSKIKLATTSYLLPLRHPLQAAEQVAAFDHLSDGRLILGIGRGMGQNTLRAFNVPPGKKRELFEQNLSLMIKAWSGETILRNDDPDSGIELHPLPVQKPYPEMWVAAFGPKALTQAGRLGLPYLASPLETIDDLANNFELHGRACQDAIQDIPLIRPVMRSVFVSEDNNLLSAIRKQLKAVSGSNIWRDSHALLDDWAIVGNQKFAQQKILEYQDRLGMSHLIVTALRQPALTEQQQQESLNYISKLKI
jgi:alkanesulfonate monooxygenase SsuD/methylene tetrahydromethanopterin reductase-like flavin-dependent oxidoreductase (luciferase family)